MSLQVSALTIPGTPFTGIDNGQFLEYGFFSIVASNLVNGGYVAGGDPLSFAGVTDFLKTGYAPLGPVSIVSQSAAQGHSGYQYYYRPGNPASLSNGKMQVLVPQGSGVAMAEIAAGAYPAAIINDTIIASAQFVRI